MSKHPRNKPTLKEQKIINGLIEDPSLSAKDLAKQAGYQGSDRTLRTRTYEALSKERVRNEIARILGDKAFTGLLQKYADALENIDLSEMDLNDQKGWFEVIGKGLDRLSKLGGLEQPKRIEHKNLNLTLEGVLPGE
mgnify:FL=1